MYKNIFYKIFIGALVLIAGALVFISLISCNFINSFKEDESDENNIEITSLALDRRNISVKVGAYDYLAVSIRPQDKQKDVKLNWEYDQEYMDCETSSWGITIKPKKEGTTSVKCKYNGFEAVCIVTISGYVDDYDYTVEPYIYSNSTIIQMQPNVTEKLFVSLYGGTAADINDYTWIVDDSDVLSIQPTGQYCMVTSKNTGYTRIKITHTKAAYPYYIGVYVFDDQQNIPYITTTNNIVSLKQEDSPYGISVTLVNGKNQALANSFTWTVVNDTAGDSPIELTSNGDKAIITPKKGGTCTIKVTHPESAYPLEIVCRVVTIVKNVYINPDTTVLNIDGEDYETVTSELKNIKIGEYSVDEYEYTLTNYDVANIETCIGNEVTLSGKANGSCKLLISHPKAAYSREVLVIVKGQTSNAVDSSFFITTSQNYIRTKVGAEPIQVNVSMKGGLIGEESDFAWTVKNMAEDGISDVIKLETSNGTVFNSRAAGQNYCYGSAMITPLAEGTATITITHPKELYPTEILVKVLDKDAVLEEPLYFTGSGILKILNGQSADYTVELKGKNKTVNDNSKITFEASDSRIRINSTENTAHVTAPSLGTGNTVSNIYVKHPKADSDKKVILLTADDEESLENMKALYSDKLYYNVEVGKSVNCVADTVGWNGTYDDEDNYIPHDFSSAVWTIKDPSVASIEKAEYNPLSCKVTGIKTGTTTVSVTYDSYKCDFTITVYPVGSLVLEPEVYLTSNQNVVNLKGINSTANVSVSAINLQTSKYSDITWKAVNDDVLSVTSNGTTAVFKALKEGETVVEVTHPDSQNTLKIYVRVGNEYIIPDTNVVYIAAQDLIMMLIADGEKTLTASLVNYTGTDTSGFSFSIDDSDIAEIKAQSTNGTAVIKPLKPGQAEITIRSTKTDIDKKVLVLVGNSEADFANLVYLSTSQNVVSVGEGMTKNINVSVKNSDDIVVSGYNWTSSNPNIIGVNGNGPSAVITGNSIGTATITVTNTVCQYPLTIIVQCIDPKLAAASPYIQLTSSVVTVNVNSNYTNVTASLVGGTDADNSGFMWQPADPNICTVYGQNEVGKLKAIKPGTTYITVSHPKAMYSAQLLVVCDRIEETDCVISVPSSVINCKPTDRNVNITASLINGTTTDKYNFHYSLDVYDIVDIQYSANIVTLTPKQTGSCTLTISHPKAAYDQQVIINVQEYTEFAFPVTNATITQGSAAFYNMHVPATNVSTYVEYSVKNSNICSITGTSSVCQITGISPGTTTVVAKLLSSSTGAVQATSEMLVYIKEKPVDAVYISSSSTVYTIQKNKSQTLSAILSGTNVTNDDIYGLQWTTSDTDIISIAGINTTGTVTGNQIFVTALKAGEALVTCSHPKAASTLQFYIVVPGEKNKTISLSKTYMTIVKGESGATLKASIENSCSKADYNNIEWSILDMSGANNTIAKIMGSGQTVTIYPIMPGQAKVTAALKDEAGSLLSSATCDVIVQEVNSLTFETSLLSVQPGFSKTIDYTVSPSASNLSWNVATGYDYFTYVDNGHDTATGKGKLTIIGNNENKLGKGTLYCTTDTGVIKTLTIDVSWDYNFSIQGATMFNITPEETKVINYSVNPVNAEISVDSTTGEGFFTTTIVDNGNGTGTVTINPLAECPGNINIRITAVNPINGDTVGMKNITGKIAYPKISVTPMYISQNGTFSRFENGVLYLGDGEDVSLGFKINESKASAQISEVSFVSTDNSRTMLMNVTDASTPQMTIKNIKMAEDDYVETELYYRIDELYVPKGIPDWEHSLSWATTENSFSSRDDDFTFLCINSGSFPVINSAGNYVDSMSASILYMSGDTDPYDNDKLKRTKYCTLIRETSENYIGKLYSEQEFKSTPWFYHPGSPKKSGGNFYYSYNDFVNGTYSIGNFGRGVSVHTKPQIMSENVKVTEVDIPVIDKTLKHGSGIIGYIQIKVIHNGLTEILDITIPVYYEIRACLFNIEN